MATPGSLRSISAPREETAISVPRFYPAAALRVSVLNLNSPGCKMEASLLCLREPQWWASWGMPGERERDSKKSEVQEDQRGPPDIFLYLPPHLEKAVATHSRTLAWKIPWMEEPGRLQSMGSLRVWHDWATSLSLFTFTHWRRKWQPTPVFLPGESQGQRSLVGCHLWGRTESDTTEAT